LVACSDLAGRIERHRLYERYDTGLDAYYGRSTLYRILRPIAIAELIEHQIAVTDFAVDESAIDCLRFKKTVTRIFSGDGIVCSHPGANWKNQEQHAFADSVSASANVLIHRAAGVPDRILRFDEFKTWLDEHPHSALEPFPTLLRDFSVDSKPILWVRLVAYGNACSSLINRLGCPLGFETRVFPIRALLAMTTDTYIASHIDQYCKEVQALELISL
jgi:hypothetical protein